METVILREFLTPLGIVRTYLTSDKPNELKKNDDFSITAAGHLVKIEEFKLQNEWLPEKMSIETSIGWRWFINKMNDIEENLTIYCHLVNPNKDTIWGYASGENLAAIIVENKSHEIHIGTEDEDALYCRSRENNWMPSRFEEILDSRKNHGYTMTEYYDYGFKTPVPKLSNSEQVYYHFLVATNPIRPSLEYPSEQDASTWYAVDQTKTFLDKYLEVQG